MRCLLKFHLDVVAANTAIQNGTFQNIMEKLMNRTKPEAAYFGVEDGCRTGYVFFEMKDSSEMPTIGESLFMGANAKIFLTPVMNSDDLKKGLELAFGS